MWGVTNILAMGVGEAPGGPSAGVFKVTCSLQPAARLKGSLVCVGVWGALEGFLADDFEVICSRPCRTGRVFAGGGHGCLLADGFKGICSSGEMSQIRSLGKSRRSRQVADGGGPDPQIICSWARQV